MSKKPANNNLPSLQELQQLQRNLPKLPDSMDPQKKRLIYGLLAVFAVIVLIIGLVYVSKNGVDGLLGSDTTTRTRTRRVIPRLRSHRIWRLRRASWRPCR